jgi:sugar/nucleoside kinase (ribokinase family)
MKIAVASHIELDTIHDMQGRITESLGGSACYCSLTARQFKFKTELATKVGKDFPLDSRLLLRSKGINIEDSHFADLPTTRLRVVKKKDRRELFLLTKCSPLTIEDIERIQTDCWIVSPVIDEIPYPVLHKIIKDKNMSEFVMFNPEGYMRVVTPGGRITLINDLELDISGISAIKVNREELSALTAGRKGIEGMRLLQECKGINFVIATEYPLIHLLHEKIHYWIKLPEVETQYYTCMGDILSSAFCCAFLKEKDPVWAICFGAGGIRAALETNSEGLDKVPSKSKIEQNASYYYNTISFRKI